MGYNSFFDLYKKILDKHRKVEGRKAGVRWITSIDKNSQDLVKLFLNAGVKIRHVRKLPPMNFAVDNRYFYDPKSSKSTVKTLASNLFS
jgi:hypothetical protein